MIGAHRGRGRGTTATAVPPPVGREERRGGDRPASVGSRLGALALDLGLLLAALLLTLFVGLSLTSDNVVLWVFVVWALVVGPLYFALYHAFGGPDGGPGATPGQHELGLCVRDAASGERLGLGRALARSYGGLLAVITVVPALVDLLTLAQSEDGRAWHDRLFGAEVSKVPRSEQALAPTPTVPALTDLFAPDTPAGAQLYRRARRLVRGHSRTIVGATLAVEIGLVVIATLLVPLIVADLGDFEGAVGAVYWAELALLLFGSGVYWTQAAIVTAVEAVRTGEARLSAGEIVRRASRRVNALTVALVLLMLPFILTMLLALSPVGWGAVILSPLLALVVPAIVLEDRTVFGALGRSWRLTIRMTGRTFVLFLVSGLVLLATIGAAVGAALGIVLVIAPDAGVLGFSLAAAFALFLVCLPVSFVLAVIGSAWCLFYYDLRRRDLARSTGS